MRKESSSEPGRITFCSIDLGIRNFALCKESISFESMVSSETLGELINKGEITYCALIDFLEGKDDSKKPAMDMKLRRKIVRILDKIKKDLEDVDLFVIEQQYSGRTGGKGMFVNMNAIKLCEIFTTWLLINFPEKEIDFISSRKKTEMFSGKGMTYAQRKKFSVEMCVSILKDRGDSETLDYIIGLKKKDDICDCILQLQAYKCEINK